MRKKGKANTFFKGMKTDMSPSAQPKDSYRYAKNIRLTSFEGSNVSLQPYDSDSLTLSLEGAKSVSTTENPPPNMLTSIIDYIVNFESAQLNTTSQFFEWAEDLEDNVYHLDLESLFSGNSDGISLFDASYIADDIVNSQNAIYDLGEIYEGFYNWFIDNNPLAPTNIVFAGFSDISMPLNMTITLTMSDESDYVMEVPVPPSANTDSVQTNSYYFETLIANAISAEFSNPIIAHIIPLGKPNLGSVQWVFTTLGSEDYVVDMSVQFFGQIQVSGSGADAQSANIEQLWNSAWENYSVASGLDEIQAVQNHITTLGYAIGQSYNYYMMNNMISDNISSEVMFMDAGNTSLYSITDCESASYVGQGGDGVSPDMQILGHYAFSDYLVLLGTWVGSGSVGTESQSSDYYEGGQDFVLKVSQKQNGRLANPIVTDEEAEGGEVFQMFFIGDLGFSDRKKLKVVGSEENEFIRRIYFTDGDIPLRTMNVGANPNIYNEHKNNPGFFDLFVEANLSIPQITGFEEGGSLDSVAHAYCFRYKTQDGRLSRMSPVCNPGSVPVTNKGTQAAFSKGGNPDENSGKSIKGVIKGLDKRFQYVQLIHIPYVAGVPGVAQVFNTLNISSGEDKDFIEWIHTGSEVIEKEILIEEFGLNNISWDTCQAMDVKDNRLFCGNLKGTNLKIDTDFSIASYNSAGYHHSYDTGNPHLYNDLLYSEGGLDFDPSGTNPTVILPEDQDEGRYAEPGVAGSLVNLNNTGSGLFRYIKNTDDPNTASNTFFSGNFNAPQYWENENELPSSYEVKRNIFGAESKYFNTQMDNGEYEGVRVTFRVLGSSNTPAEAIQLDKDDRLISSGDYKGARAPFYKLDNNLSAGYYANYANPYYNSNFVGYRRGEIYRFGLLFYDKKGSPMFVKRIGDVRMPEHSTEYCVPDYDSSYAYGISGVKKEWPFYYQTSRSNLDGGFADWPGADWDAVENGEKAYQKPYSDHPSSKGSGQYGCVLYPYFEIKLSSETCKKISGYSIVRVERTPDNRTISTSGILQRAVHYADNNPETLWNGEGQMTETNDNGLDRIWYGANRVDMDGRYGNDPMPLWTNTIQEYRSHKYGNPGRDYTSNPGGQGGVDGGLGNALSISALGGDDPIGGHPNWTHSNIFTMDSPDAIINPNFSLNFSSGDRIKITESRYCIKENVNNGGNNNLKYPSFLNNYLSEGAFPGGNADNLPSNTNPDFKRASYSVSLFSSLIATDLLEGDSIDYQGESVDFGGWSHRTAPQWQWSTDWKNDWRAFDKEYRGVNNYNDGNWANDDSEPNPHNDFEEHQYKLGIYSKYYSKRIGAYPMYGMARPDWNKYHQNLNQVDGTGSGFSMNCRDVTYAGHQYTPQFLAGNVWPEADGTTQDTWYGNLTLDSSDDFYSGGVRATNVLPDIIARGHLDSDIGEVLDAYTTNAGEWWNESRLSHAAIVGPGEEVPMSDLGSDRPFKNATMWHDFCGYNRVFSLNSTTDGANIQYGCNIDGNSGGSDHDDMDVYTEHTADYVLSNRTIVMSLPHHAMLPITRHCLQRNNWRERIFWQFGGTNMDKNGNIHQAQAQGYGWTSSGSTLGATGGGSVWSQYSPEVTMASIVKNKTASTMYGGNTPNAFSKNSFISTGHFQQVNTVDSFSAVGEDGNHVFGGDTYICNFSLKKVHDPETSREYNDPSGNPNEYANKGVLTAYTCPVETETNLDLRHGLFFGGDNQNIPKQLEDDYGSISYNLSYNSENIIQLFKPKPLDFIEVNHWPSTMAWSEPKFPGDFNDSFSLFPVGQIKDLDYSKGPITQMFLLQNDLFALQNSGTCKLSVNPRVMIPSGDGGHIATITGTDSVVERYDYISESWGSQHFHGLAVSDRSAYFYDDNASKFIKLGRGQGGGWGVMSLGDSLGMQSHFLRYHNVTINDKPLHAYDWSRNSDPQIPEDYWRGFFQSTSDDTHSDGGGVSIGYDPEYSEIFLTIFPNVGVPETIVYNESLDVFTSFISRRPAQYINFKNRLYCTYYDESYSSNKIYLSNAFSTMSATTLMSFADDVSIFKYLNFGGVDYYIFGEEIQDDTEEGYVNPFESEEDTYTTPVIAPFVGGHPSYLGVDEWGINDFGNSDIYMNAHPEIFGVEQRYRKVKEPVQIQFVINDEPNQSKVFDNLDINIESNTFQGQNYLYFRKFAFKGSANLYGVHEFDMSEYTFGNVDDNGITTQQDYSNANIGFQTDAGKRMWYTVKEGTHHVPFKPTGIGKVDYEGGTTSGAYMVDDEGEPLEGSSESEIGGFAQDITCRGNYSIVAMVMGWDEGEQFFGGSRNFSILPSGVSQVIIPKNEHFSILSIIPYYRYSRR